VAMAMPPKQESIPSMMLTKLSASRCPGWTCRLVAAPSGYDAGTASQLIPGVGRT
jgi:hypothetical protein